MPIKARSSSALLGVCLAILCGTTFAASSNARKAQLKEKQGEVRERIESLRRDLAKNEESQADTADQLRETELAISHANRSLRQLSDKRDAVQGEIRNLETQSRQLAERTATQQEHLSRLLYRHYTGGNQTDMDAFAQLMTGRDPNQAALDYHYLKSLSQAKADLIADLRDKEKEKKRLAEAARTKKTELDAIDEKQRQARVGLLEQQKQRQQLLAKTAKKIKAQQREIGALKKDEKRLTGLIAKLAQAAKRTSKRPAKPTRSNKPTSTARNERTPDPAQAGGAFASLRGKLSLPVRGDIANRFGTRRPEGGTTWKGLFIRASEGTEVQAVAAGEVVYADWLRGFGNLLIVDHGDEFLSVYGNNQSLLKETGQPVAPGEVVATVGNTGGNPESGLYFELRHQGQAFDPIRWVRLR